MLLGRAVFDCIDLADRDKLGWCSRLVIMDCMRIRSQQDHATYAAIRFCRAIDRVLNAETSAEKMKANLWAAA